ncbi:Uncharacterised protein [Mycobacteroides abscessus subsp. abscessus]|nr:Uncharacterised protein [Mycobacteroides abscessus subsp. abscessus]SKW51240.1 Uncharacterised protein [Mycobacteroides abscessus subsp. abscessus]
MVFTESNSVRIRRSAGTATLYGRFATIAVGSP